MREKRQILKKKGRIDGSHFYLFRSSRGLVSRTIASIVVIITTSTTAASAATTAATAASCALGAESTTTTSIVVVAIIIIVIIAKIGSGTLEDGERGVDAGVLVLVDLGFDGGFVEVHEGAEEVEDLTLNGGEGRLDFVVAAIATGVSIADGNERLHDGIQDISCANSDDFAGLGIESSVIAIHATLQTTTDVGGIVGHDNRAPGVSDLDVDAGNIQIHRDLVVEIGISTGVSHGICLSRSEGRICESDRSRRSEDITAQGVEHTIIVVVDEGATVVIVVVVVAAITITITTTIVVVITTTGVVVITTAIIVVITTTIIVVVTTTIIVVATTLIIIIVVDRSADISHHGLKLLKLILSVLLITVESLEGILLRMYHIL